ncbi:hypothetical protein V2P20_09055 [Methylobacter sp. Wu1]|uniref:hypothetical protein n=1 Tax=Methylobacter sp. Wu1 TaxID=3119359 RepID=UPI002F954D22
MALETGTYISDLVPANPPGSDPKSQGDDHLRLIKSTIKATFPNITGAVTPTHTELNYVDGVLEPIQDQINSKPAKNFIINGRFNVQQDDQSVIGAVNGDYIGDVWKLGKTTTATHNLGVGTPGSMPSVADAGYLLTNAAIVRCSGADAAVAPGDYTYLLAHIEGYDWLNLAEKPLKLGFWVWSSKTGTFCVALRNSGSDRSVILEYTVNSASTWEFKELTIPASPSAGTWDYTTGVGCAVIWTLMSGNTYQTTAGSWQTGNFLATANQVNFNDADTNYFYITGVKLSAESHYSAIEPEDYQQELARVQRRYWKGLPMQAGNFPAYAGNAVGSWTIKFPVTMRATPTMAVDFSGITLSNLGTPSVGQANVNGCRMTAISSAANANCNFSFAANNYIEADARL